MINDFVAPKKGPRKKIPKIEPKSVPIEAPLIEPVQEPVETTVEPPKKTQPNPVKSKPKKQFHIWPASWSTKKKRVFTGLLIAGLVALLAGGGYYWYHRTHQPKRKAVVVKVQPPAPVPTTAPSPLTGATVSIPDSQRAVTAVMIENSPDARPQSGLLQAGVVYEAVAEGGITRFLALFQEAQPDYVGPIRSSRPYYLDWLLPFDAAYAHVGGSPEALQQIKDLHVKDLDQFYNSGSYHRVTQRYAPHNVYTSIGELYSLAQSKGYTTSTFTGFPRKAEKPSAAPTAKSIDFAISSYLYNPHFDYDTASNSYKRSEGGKPHVDEKSGSQLSPKVVVALVTPSALEADGTHNSYATTGSGAMYVFQDGEVTKGTWKKDSRTAQFTFTNEAGQPLKLNPGQTWVSLVTSDGAVTYKP